ncbi:MAG: peptidoglycan-binding protein [Alphaproteobacteria bacterium]|nr:peptidoglycan-binding protein [Alphaproteobacteria bacterium]
MLRGITIAALGYAIISVAAITSGILNQSYAAETGSEDQNVQMTPALIREIQFMLLRLGLDPGPIDGVVGRQTNGAVNEFQRQAGLPVTDLANTGTVSMAFLTRLREQAERAIFSNQQAPQPSPGSTALGSPAPIKAAPDTAVPGLVKPPPDRFAACPFNPGDFRIGDTQYTPDKFLQVGFGGSTARAVTSLKERLDEARQLAENVGGPALAEVQRQARVLDYFDCRLKIEQAATDKK